MFNDSHFRQGGTNLDCFPVGGWLTTPASPPVYGPGTQRKLYSLGLALGIIGLHWALLARVGHYWLASRGRVGYARLFRYQHVGIPNAKSSCCRSKLTRGPNANGFALQWNIGLTVTPI